ncbi:MAG TPA: hypothetical protein VIF09_15995 [Polyangiaceae bacterium]|jgi:hypothetical protein
MAGDTDDPKGPGTRSRAQSSPEFDEEPKSRTGRFNVQHRGGTHVEVGEPIRVGGDRPWMCAVKLVGKKRDPVEDPEPTQTLLVRTGRGLTAEDARRDALAQLTLVYGSPVEPPPSPIISQKPSDPPPSPAPVRAPDPPKPRKSWIGQLIDKIKGD